MDAYTSEMVEMTFPVTEIRGEKVSGTGTATRIGPCGMEIASCDVPPGRFAWIGFTLPGMSRSIRALGEIMGVRREGGSDSVIVRFKHVFPADRAALSGLAAARAAA